MSRIRANNPSLSEVTLRAIEDQINNRTLKDADGNLLCRHCNKVIPEDMLKVLKDPEREDRVWGPCCSDECICYLKICHGCYKDFIVNKPEQIKFINNEKWLCTECQGNQDICKVCGSMDTVLQTSHGKLCHSCYATKFFKCVYCDQEHDINNKVDHISLAKYSHIFGGQKHICTSCFLDHTKEVLPLKIKECKCCGDTYGYKKVLNHSYCPTCIKKKAVRRCHHCNKFHHDFSMCGTVSGNHILCEKCKPKYKMCEICHRLDLLENSIITKGSLHTKYTCSECSKEFKECPKCLSLITIKDLQNGGCNRCSSEICKRCGKNHHGEHRCRKIMIDTMEYSFKPSPIFHYIGNNKKVFFGFENEINYNVNEDNLYARKHIYDSFEADTIYVKSDSTIDRYGFEVVSHPMTHDFFKTLDLSPLFIIEPIKNDTSCGLHIHLSKQSFQGDYHLYKFISFINDPNNKSFIESISGRSLNNSYGHVYSDKISSVVKNKYSNERRSCVNLTNNHTYEVRIFKGAKDLNELTYRIEFTLALVEFTRNTTRKSCTKDNFLKFLKNNYKSYKTLNEFLK